MISEEDRDVIEMCNINHRRSNLTTTVGYIVPAAQARQFAEYEVAQQHSGDLRGMAVMVIATLAVICVTVAALI